MKLDAKLNEALVNLKPNSNFKLVMDHLNKYEAELTMAAIYSNEPAADVFRGMARSVCEINKAIRKASNN